MSTSTVYVSPDTAIRAIETLLDEKVARFHRETRSVLYDYLLLKAKQGIVHPGTPSAVINIVGTGTDSVEDVLDRYFGLAPNTPKPYVNPFGKRQQRLQWLAKGYARSGLYTNLENGNLTAYVNAQRQSPTPPTAAAIGASGQGASGARRQDVSYTVSIPLSAAGKIVATNKGGKVPLEPTAALMLRREQFPASATSADLVNRFQQLLNLTNQELTDLFEPLPSFQVDFDPTGFRDGLASLPVHLRPDAASAGQTTVAAVVTRSPGRAAAPLPQLVVDPTVERRLLQALKASPVIALVGPPGTGKSRLVKKLIEEIRTDPASFGFTLAPEYVVRTAETGWTERDIIGAHFPTKDGMLAFEEGYLLSAITNNEWLVLDEMNRADLDRVLGAALTFLAREDVDLPKTELSENGRRMLLRWDPNSAESYRDDDDPELRTYAAGTEWRLIGTYNDVDLGRVFSMGAGLSRRVATVRVPPLSIPQFDQVLVNITGLPAEAADLLRRVYAEHLSIPLGPALFVDIANYVVRNTPPGGFTSSPGGVAPDLLQLLIDGYVTYVEPQLRRVDPEELQDFVDAVDGILPGIRDALGYDL